MAKVFAAAPAVLLVALLSVTTPESCCAAEAANASQTIAASPGPIESGELEIMSRGPIHEAFAALTTEVPTPPPLVHQKPPRPIAERVPALAPAADARWIPGYWSWNDQLDCWVWLSGAWRRAPADRHWMPGYWSHSPAGYRWVAGFWLGSTAEAPRYVGEPPARPGQAADVRPRTGQFRIAGYWRPQADTFIWQNAAVATFEAGRVWMPSQYYWTPAGYVFVDGYWDHPLSQRGWLFVPLGLTDPETAGSQFALTPEVLLKLESISLALFARPRERWYYFGDYDGANDRRCGFIPIAEYAGRNAAPIFDYLNWYYGRQNPHWLRDAQAAARSRRVQGFAGLTAAGAQARQHLVWLGQASERAELGNRFVKLTPAQQAVVHEQIAALRAAVSARHKTEFAQSVTNEAPAVAARQAAARQAGPAHPRLAAAEFEGLAGSETTPSGSTNLTPKSIVARNGFSRDDLNIDSFRGREDLTADASIGSGLRVEIAPSLYGTAAVAGRSMIATGGGARGLSSRAMIYNGLPIGVGNTFGAMAGNTLGGGLSGPATLGGVPSLPSGIGSGYQGGSPAGGFNAPGGYYGLGSPGGGGAFYGAGGGGTGHGSPGGGS